MPAAPPGMYTVRPIKTFEIRHGDQEDQEDHEDHTRDHQPHISNGLNMVDFANELLFIIW